MTARKPLSGTGAAGTATQRKQPRPGHPLCHSWANSPQPRGHRVLFKCLPARVRGQLAANTTRGPTAAALGGSADWRLDRQRAKRTLWGLIPVTVPAVRFLSMLTQGRTHKIDTLQNSFFWVFPTEPHYVLHFIISSLEGKLIPLQNCY